MPKKSALKKFHKRAAQKLLSNPGKLMKWVPEGLVDVVPGFGAYAGSRLASRLAWKALAQKRFGRHAAPLVGVGAVVGAFLACRHPSLRKYAVPVLIGTGIAAVQTLMQTYLPSMGWVVSDWSSGQYQIGAGSGGQALVPTGESFDDTAYYDETGDAGGADGGDAPAAGPGPQGVAPQAAAAGQQEWVPDIADELDDLGSLAGGMN